MNNTQLQKLAQNISFPFRTYKRNEEVDSKVKKEDAIHFHEAIKNNLIDKVQELIKENPHLINYELNTIGNPSDRVGNFHVPLRTSLIFADDAITDLLMEHGADVTTKNTLSNNATLPFYYAVDFSKTRIVKQMLKRGADPNLKTGMERDITVLEISLERQPSGEIALALLDHGASPTEDDLRAVGIKESSKLSLPQRVELLRNRLQNRSQ